MAEVNFVTPLHIGTKRDYGARATADKGACAAVARQWGVDYWDGARAYGFGGMRYDGRWLPVAEAMARHYGLRAGDRVLDIGCGKGFLLYELTRAVPGLEVAGLDISTYAVEHAKPEVHSQLTVGTASTLPWPDAQFDLVLSINTLHNLYNYELDAALAEIMRVGRRHRYICVESYRNEVEKANLLYWQLTCEAFCTPREWHWLFDRHGYRGDWEFIFFD